MAIRTPLADGLAVAPNAGASGTNPAASTQELAVHRFWGRWAAATDLPNAAGNLAASPAYDQMRPGDMAYVLGTTTLYTLINRGTASGGDAVWVQISTDVHRFAPTIVVGNTPAGDPVLATAAPFQYIADIGDGAGIAAAFAAAAAAGAGAWVHIRRGTYDLGLGGSPALPLAIAGFRVTGDGASTGITMSTADRRVFALTSVPPGTGVAAELADLSIVWKSALAGASGVTLIDASASARALVRNVTVIKPGAPVENALETLTSIFLGGAANRFLNCRGVNIDGNNNTPVVCFRMSGLDGAVQNCQVAGTNVGARLANERCKVIGSDFDGSGIFATATGVQVDAGSCVVEGNSLTSLVDGIVSRTGGGATIMGNVLGAGFGTNGIRVDAGATDNIVVGNRLNGNSFLDAGTGTESGHNTP